MDYSNLTFGEYIAQKRIQMNISLREMAKLMEFSAPYWSGVEKGKKNPPKYEKLERLSDILCLDESEKSQMFDLAGKYRNTIAPDVEYYILDNESIIKTFRMLRKMGADENDWRDFLKRIKNKKNKKAIS